MELKGTALLLLAIALAVVGRATARRQVLTVEINLDLPPEHRYDALVGMKNPAGVAFNETVRCDGGGRSASPSQRPLSFGM